MLLPRKEDVLHKAWLLRLLTRICEERALSSRLAFKGGTCAALRGFLNRFSIDLDFDLRADRREIPAVRQAFEKIFAELSLEIKDQSSKAPQYLLRYPGAEVRERRTIKIDSCFPIPKSNVYEAVRLPEIDRVFTCQTLETMVANKLVGFMARYEKTRKIAGRDLYDIHFFLLRGYAYRSEVILEQRKGTLKEFFEALIDFVKREVTNTVIDQDLNYLLPEAEFRRIRKVLKQETLLFLKDEYERL